MRATIFSKADVLNLPINRETCFSNHKKGFKDKIMKTQTKILTDFSSFLKPLLESGEGILLIALVSNILGALRGIESWGPLLFVAVILFFEKSITIYHTKRYVSEYIPVDKNFLPASLNPAGEPSSP